MLQDPDPSEMQGGTVLLQCAEEYLMPGSTVPEQHRHLLRKVNQPSASGAARCLHRTAGDVRIRPEKAAGAL